jgi:hypothetical protein
MQILVVEDDVQLARLVSSALIEAGHDPIFVHNGERAFDKAKETPFDLVVLDIILPGMDGFNVLRHLRSQHTTADRMAAHRKLDRRRVYLCAGVSPRHAEGDGLTGLTSDGGLSGVTSDGDSYYFISVSASFAAGTPVTRARIPCSMPEESL